MRCENVENKLSNNTSNRRHRLPGRWDFLERNRVTISRQFVDRCVRFEIMTPEKKKKWKKKEKHVDTRWRVPGRVWRRLAARYFVDISKATAYSVVKRMHMDVHPRSKVCQRTLFYKEPLCRKSKFVSSDENENTVITTIESVQNFQKVLWLNVA